MNASTYQRVNTNKICKFYKINIYVYKILIYTHHTQDEVSPAITKTMAKIFVEMELLPLKEGGEGKKEAAGGDKKGEDEKDGGDGKDGKDRKDGLKAREGMVASAKTNPLHALRVAQVKAFNGAPFVLDAGALCTRCSAALPADSET